MYTVIFIVSIIIAVTVIGTIIISRKFPHATIKYILPLIGALVTVTSTIAGYYHECRIENTEKAQMLKEQIDSEKIEEIQSEMQESREKVQELNENVSTIASTSSVEEIE